MLANRAQLHALDAELATRQLDLEAQIRSTELELEIAMDKHKRVSSLTDQGIAAGKREIEADYAVQMAEARLTGLRTTLGGYMETRQRLRDYIGKGTMPEDAEAWRGASASLLTAPTRFACRCCPAAFPIIITTTSAAVNVDHAKHFAMTNAQSHVTRDRS
jgi:hypothetical protein